jgi:uncharacterized protein YndB with AHSA1/START domain
MMSKPEVIHSTFVVERSIPAPPQRVFEAFADPELKKRWFAEGDQHDVEEFAADFQVGGVERLRYRFREGTQFAGLAISNTDTILDVVPDRRIVSSSRMSFGDSCISAALVTTELLPSETGIDLVLTFQGAYFEGADGPEIREMGWRDLLERLASVV